MTIGRVTFICAGDPARVHMAEGFLRRCAGDRLQLFSLGSATRIVNPNAFLVMKEVGIDISTTSFKTMNELRGRRVNYAITICDCPGEPCLTFHGSYKPEKWEIEDPCCFEGSNEERVEAFRRARDEIKARIDEFIGRISWRLRATATDTTGRIPVCDGTVVDQAELARWKRL